MRLTQERAQSALFTLQSEKFSISDRHNFNMSVRGQLEEHMVRELERTVFVPQNV
jgi:hypothetical protein